MWAFSAAYNFCNDDTYLHIANRAFEYINNYFIDKEYGGVFWTVDARGNPLDTKKQIYALAFCIYGFSEYSASSGNTAALKQALNIFNVIESYSYDNKFKGYLEALKRNWKTADDLRLNAKDANEKKTMNTHLHIIEAYANLYKVHASPQLKQRIIQLLELFDSYFIGCKTFHLKLFFDEAWNEKPGVIPYGHDIEAAWLLLQCAEIIQEKALMKVYNDHTIKIAEAAAEGLNKDEACGTNMSLQKKH